MFERILTLLRLWRTMSKLLASPIGRAARRAVELVAAHQGIQAVAVKEPVVSFCPRCGQLPSGDRRMEEARQMAVAMLGRQPKISELNFALEWYFFWRKGNA